MSDEAEERYMRTARDIVAEVVGPMPVKKFLRRYFELPNSPPREINSVSFDRVPARPKNEQELYQPLVSSYTCHARTFSVLILS